MERWTGEAFECARRALEARDGQDDETRLALERCAGKFALRALGLLREPVEQTEGPPQMSSSGPPRIHQPWRGRRCA